MSKEKTVKVKITKKVSTFAYQGKIFYPGDIVEIEKDKFRKDFMEIVSKASKVTEKAVAKSLENVEVEYDIKPGLTTAKSEKPETPKPEESTDEKATEKSTAAKDKKK